MGASGTSFSIVDFGVFLPGVIDDALRVASVSEIAEIEAKCRAGQAMCLSGPDGLVVVDLRPAGGHLEMYVWLAVAYRHGAFLRQEPALLAIARDLGAETMAFTSRREGWARRLGPQWSRRGNEFVRTV